jgi:hypothetical protein
MNKSIVTNRMQSLMDCIDALYNEEGNTYTKLEIVAGSYSDTYKSINGIRPRGSHMNEWTYEDYIYHHDKLADDLADMEKYEQEQKELKKKRISNALKDNFSNSPFSNFFQEVNNA